MREFTDAERYRKASRSSIHVHRYVNEVRKQDPPRVEQYALSLSGAPSSTELQALFRSTGGTVSAATAGALTADVPFVVLP
jgi:hypothetical protein